MKRIVHMSMYMFVMLVLYSATIVAMAPVNLNNGADTRKKMNAATDVNTAANILVTGFNQFFYNGGTDEREITAAIKEFRKKWGLWPFDVVRNREVRRLEAARDALEEQNDRERRESEAHIEGLETAQEEAVAHEQAAQRQIAAYEEAARNKSASAQKDFKETQGQLLEQQKNLESLKNLLSTEQNTSTEFKRRSLEIVGQLNQENGALRQRAQASSDLASQLELRQAQLDAERSTNKLQLAGLQAKTNEYKKRADECKEENDKLKEELKKLEEENGDLQQQLKDCDELRARIQQLENQKQLVEVAKGTSDLSCQAARAEAEACKKDKAALAKELQAVQRQLANANKTLQDYAAERGRSSSPTSQGMTDRLAALEQENDALNKKLKDCEEQATENEEMQAQLSQCKQEKEQVDRELSSTKPQVEELRGNLEQTQKTVKKLQAELIKKVPSTAKDMQKQLNDLQDKYDQAMQALKDVTVDRDHLYEQILAWEENFKKYESDVKDYLGKLESALSQTRGQQGNKEALEHIRMLNQELQSQHEENQRLIRTLEEQKK